MWLLRLVGWRVVACVVIAVHAELKPQSGYACQHIKVRVDRQFGKGIIKVVGSLLVGHAVVPVQDSDFEILLQAGVEDLYAASRAGGAGMMNRNRCGSAGCLVLRSAPCACGLFSVFRRNRKYAVSRNRFAIRNGSNGSFHQIGRMLVAERTESFYAHTVAQEFEFCRHATFGHDVAGGAPANPSCAVAA